MSIELTCAGYRGIIINHVIDLEELIDHIFMQYYVWLGNTLATAEIAIERQQEFQHTIISKQNVNLALKFDSLAFLLNKYCEEYLKDKPRKKGQIVFMTEIRKIIELRNTFAHRKLDKKLSNEVKKEVVLIYHTTEDGKITTKRKNMNPALMKKFLEEFYVAYEELEKAGNQLLMTSEKRKGLEDYKNKKGH